MLFKILYIVLFISSGIWGISQIDELELRTYETFSFLSLTSVFWLLRITIGLLFSFSLSLVLGFLGDLQFRFLKSLKILVVIICLSTPFIISPPDSFSFGTKITDPEQIEQLNNYLENQNFPEGNHLVGFYSPRCSFCKKTLRKLNVLSSKLNSTKNIHYNFSTDKQEVDSGFKLIDFQPIPSYKLIDLDSLLEICDYSLPKIFLLKNKEVINQYNYRSFNDSEIIELLEK